ncbi:hypothetical protein E2C01_003692 [Portunus trituberculatus]|uniref:Uncharacterized protein n=1 Tax=Portunus trituberculatus TaxID=210409 RepID=A0A5B7CNM8_PORTR|nr:hypothetical protein [Portunus trituberculatus]
MSAGRTAAQISDKDILRTVLLICSDAARGEVPHTSIEAALTQFVVLHQEVPELFHLHLSLNLFAHPSSIKGSHGAGIWGGRKCVMDGRKWRI